MNGHKIQPKKSQPALHTQTMTTTGTTDEFGRTLIEGNTDSITSHGQSGQERWAQDRMGAPPSIKPSSVTLGGKVFEDSKTLWNYTKALRDSLNRDDVVEGKALTILLALLDRHPRAAEKIGSGVEKITFGEHKTFVGTQCFFIHRKDGTVEDFSFRKCIQAIFPSQPKTTSAKDRSGNNKRKGGSSKDYNSYGSSSSSSSSSVPNEIGSSTKKARSSTLDTSLVGCCFRVKNLPVGTRWSDLKTYVEVWGKVKHIQFLERGSTETVVQMSEEKDLPNVQKSFVEMDGKEVDVTILTKEEEQEHYKKNGNK